MLHQKFHEAKDIERESRDVLCIVASAPMRRSATKSAGHTFSVNLHVLFLGTLSVNIRHRASSNEEQLSPDVIGGLGSALGKDQATASKAASGAIPARLLAVLASLLKSPDGIQKLISALRTFDAGALGRDCRHRQRTGNTRRRRYSKREGDVLGSLLGPGTLSLLIAALSKFTNLDATSTKGLLGTLLPLVLGVISNHFKGKPVDSSSVTDFFKQQANNITAAIPPGLSLAGIPGGSDLKSAGANASSGVPVVGLCRRGIGRHWGCWDILFTSQGPQEAAPNPEVAPASRSRHLLRSRLTCPSSVSQPPTPSISQPTGSAVHTVLQSSI